MAGKLINITSNERNQWMVALEDGYSIRSLLTFTATKDGVIVHKNDGERLTAATPTITIESSNSFRIE